MGKLHKILDKSFWENFRVKNRDFWGIFGGFDFIANYLEMNKII